MRREGKDEVCFNDGGGAGYMDGAKTGGRVHVGAMLGRWAAAAGRYSAGVVGMVVSTGPGHAGRLTPALGLSSLSLAAVFHGLVTVAVGRCALRLAQSTIQKVFQYSNSFSITKLIQICKIIKWYF
jgi:hypothetical protein